ncbi:MAG: cytochrome c biogenesis protein CcsA [Rhodospirillales bacterium]
MTNSAITSVLAALALLPALFASLKSRDRADGIYRAAVFLAIVGPAYWLISAGTHGWTRDLAGALWASVAATIVVYAVVALMTRAGWRLGVIVFPYVSIIAAIAALRASTADTGPVLGGGPAGWLVVHAVTSVLTYAVATVGAIAAAAGYVQQRALKDKSPTSLSRRLPSLADCDALQIRLLGLCALVLGFGLLSGTATSLAREGVWFSLDHKTILGALAFIVISVLLVANRRGDVRARQIGRAALSAYLLLTLAYVGVKVVTDVML